MTAMNDILPTDWTPKSSIIKVIGVGGGGCNAVTYMYDQKIEGCDFIVCNTDAQALQKSSVPNKLQLGQGLGAGCDPVKGRNAALEAQDNIASTLHLLSENDLAKAVSSIIAAQNIYVLGTRGNFSVAHYLGYRLSQIKRGVHLVSGLSMDYPEEIASIRRGDVCIAFLTPRYSRMTANLVAWMKKRGVMIILFTKEGSSEINLYGDIILPCRTDGISYKSSLIALFAVCNYILAAVVPQNHDESMEVLAQTEELLGQGFFLGL